MRYLLVPVSLVLLAGCRTTPDAPRGSELVATHSTPVPPQFTVAANARGIVGDSVEAALIAQVKGLFPGKKGSDIETALKDPRVYDLKVGSLGGQAIVDHIYARRRARADSVVASQPGKIDVGSLLHVTVALVDSLDDPAVTAEIWRRVGMEPHDVILISARRATTGALGAAIHGLGKLWREDGQVAPLRDLRVKVHGEMRLSSWSSEEEQLLAAELARGLQRSPHAIAGVGYVPSFQLYLRQPASTPSSKP